MADETEMKTILCKGPPPHEFQIPKRRGRNPDYCDEHNPKKQSTSTPNKENQVPEQTPRSRPRPGAASRPAPRPAPQSSEGSSDNPPAPDPGMRRLPPVGTADTKSRAKAESAANRTSEMVETIESASWPRGSGGRPMARITMSASELVPTGQYANVSVGPAQITHFIDLDRDIDEGGYFTDAERDVLKVALNELAGIVEGDVIAVQRNLVLESMQEQMSSANGN